jgi:hypothetical protein
MVNIFKPKNLFKNMKENNQTVIITCKYHNGRNGYHDPYSLGETIVAIGTLNGKYLTIDNYTSLFETHALRCIHCPYAKLYLLNEGIIRERNGNGKINITGIKLRGQPVNPEKIKEEARRLGFPYL